MPKKQIDKKQKVAIFDVDGTIFRSSLLIELVEALIERNIFPHDAWKKYEQEEKSWLERQGDYEAYIQAVIKTFQEHLKGVLYKEFAEVSDEVVARLQNRVYRYTRDLVGELKKKKYYLLAISQSPKTTVDVFCKNMGFDKVYGRIYELGPEDRFTGIIVDTHLIENKANIVRRAVEKEDLSLKGSYGVGDTESDISMLELVEHPIAFNPNSMLYKYARRMEWKVIVERKDVIYEL